MVSRIYRVHKSGLILLPFIIALLAFIAVGCSEESDNPAAGDGDSDHLHAEGVMLIRGSDTLIQVEGTAVNDTIILAAGDTLTGVMVWFFDPDSGWIHPVEEESGAHVDHDHELSVESSDTTVVQTVPAEEWGGEEDPWSMVLLPRSAGNATLRVHILHLDHPDYTSPALPVRVVPAGRP